LKAAVASLIALGITAALEDESNSVALTDSQMKSLEGGALFGECYETGYDCKSCRPNIGGWWEQCTEADGPEKKCDITKSGTCSVPVPDCPGTCYHYSNDKCTQNQALRGVKIYKCVNIE
jgi:hypothetical protein